MDSLVTIPSIILGGILIAVYCALCMRRRCTIEIGSAVNFFLLASGIVCGIVLIVGAFYDGLLDTMSGMGLYIAIGGTAVLIVSAQSVAGVFRSLPPPLPSVPQVDNSRDKPTEPVNSGPSSSVG